jgi:chitodextrinase
MILVAVAALVLIAGGTSYALTSAFRPDRAGDPVITNSHVPVVVPGPSVPTPSGSSSDTTKPAAPAALRVTSRSISAVTLDWADAVDNVGVTGYIVLRGGVRVGTTFEPGFTDSQLRSQTRYQYAVSAFDAAGNVSKPSVPVSATTLTEPDVSPPSVPGNLRSTGRSMTTIVLAWSASHDNVGVAGYEVYRDGALIANVPRPGYTDKGLGASTSHTYRVRAFDTSNNASADSGAVTVTTLAAPDASPPSTPTNVTATGVSPTAINVTWSASTDNVGVTLYKVYRDGVFVANVAAPGFTDQGLTPSTSYDYRVRAYDANNNPSALSAVASGSTMAQPTTPPPTTPPDPTTAPPTTPAPEVLALGLTTDNTDCVTVAVNAIVTVSGPMTVSIAYTITGAGTGSVGFTFVDGDPLTQSVALPSGDGTGGGTASASAGGVTAPDSNWAACPPPPTTEPPTDPPPTDEGGEE